MRTRTVHEDMHRRLNSVREKKRRMGTDENVLSDMRDCQHRIQKQRKRSKIRV